MIQIGARLASGPEGRIFLVRHGQTAWNGRRYLGWEDVPLDHVGTRQAQETARRLAQEPLDVIYSSPLTRAAETIRPLAESRGLPVLFADDLREMHYGRWQGAPKSEFRLRVEHDHRHLPLPGGESLFDVHRRAERFLDSLQPDLAAGRRLVVVGHFRVNQMLLGAIGRLPFEAIVDQADYRPGHASIFLIRYVTDPQGSVHVLASGFMDADREGPPR